MQKKDMRVRRNVLSYFLCLLHLTPSSRSLSLYKPKPGPVLFFRNKGLTCGCGFAWWRRGLPNPPGGAMAEKPPDFVGGVKELAMEVVRKYEKADEKEG
jgi:hypothetical protein